MGLKPPAISLNLFLDMVPSSSVRRCCSRVAWRISLCYGSFRFKVFKVLVLVVAQDAFDQVMN